MVGEVPEQDHPGDLPRPQTRSSCHSLWFSLWFSSTELGEPGDLGELGELLFAVMWRHKH